MNIHPGENAAEFADSDAWLRMLIVRMFQLMHHFEPDNFDGGRYQGIAPNTFFFERHADYFGFLLKNARNFFQARCLLSDEQSKALYDRLVLFRILGHMHVRLPFNTPGVLDFDSVTSQWKIEDSNDVGMFGPLAVFAIPTDSGVLRIKCWSGNVAASFLYSQYFFYRDGESIAPESGDEVIDGGGCFGDTALVFANAIGGKGRVHTFDPLKKHCEIMRESFAMHPALAGRISIHEVGLANEDNQGSPSHGRDYTIDPGARVVVGGDLPTRSIDSLVNEGVITRIDYIKMDIEGSELPALIGAEQSLSKVAAKTGHIPLSPTRRFLFDTALAALAERGI
jgi:FkbM family methyltransferase